MYKYNNVELKHGFIVRSLKINCLAIFADIARTIDKTRYNIREGC